MADLTGMLQAAAGNAGEEADEDFANTVLLLHGDGTNGAQNNTFLDSSTNNFTITRAGNTTQGTFSPFSKPDGKWGLYSDGTTDRLSIPDNAAFDVGTGDFTIEAFVYHNNAASTTESYCIHTNNGLNIGRSSTGKFFIARTGSPATLTGSTTLNAGTWYHVAAARSGTTLKLFVNGVEDASGTKTDDFTGTSTFYIFANSGLNGVMSNLRLIKSTAIYTSAFTPPTSPLTAISGTSLLTCQSNRFVDNSGNNFPISLDSGTPKVTPFSPFPITTAFSPSVNGGAGYFDESGDYLNTGLFSLNFSEFCLEFWLNTTSTTLNQTFINRGGSTWNISTVFNIYMSTTAGRITFLAGATVGFDTGTSSPVNDGAWHHLVFTYDGTRYRVFQDGVLRGTQTAASMGSDSQPMYFMHDPRTARYGQGYLSDFRLVTGSGNIPAAYQTASTTLGTQIFTSPTAPLTAITGTQLLCNFTNAGILDNTGFNALETVGNAQVDTTKKYGTGSIEFDGTGDNLTIASNPSVWFGSGAFTIEMWLYPNNAASEQMLVAGSDTGAIFLGMNIDGANRIALGRKGIAVDNQVSYTYSTGAWIHLACVRDSSNNIYFFVDGTQVGSTGTNSNSFTNSTLNIGFEPTQKYLNGFIDDLRITKGIARYTTTFTPPTKAFPDIGS